MPVNFNMVKRKLAKGLTTGVGVFASTFVGNAVANNSSFSNIGVAASQMAIGAGVAVATDARPELTGGRNALLNEGIEHVGYGIHGAGFAELADAVNSQTGASRSTGQSADRVVTVDARASGGDSSGSAQEFSLDTA